MQHIGWDAWARRGDVEAESFVLDVGHVVEVAVERGVEHGTCVLDFHAVAHAVGAA